MKSIKFSVGKKKRFTDVPKSQSNLLSRLPVQYMSTDHLTDSTKMASMGYGKKFDFTDPGDKVSMPGPGNEDA